MVINSSITKLGRLTQAADAVHQTCVWPKASGCMDNGNTVSHGNTSLLKTGYD